MKKKVVLTYCLDKRDTTAFWRGPWRDQIYHNEFEVRDISDLKVFDWTVFQGVDIFWIQRPFATEHVQVISAAKNANLKVILDYDDDLLNVDLYNPTYTQYKNNLQNIKSCISMADEIWTSTQSIKDTYLPYNKNIHVILNAHNDTLFPVLKSTPFNYNKKCYYRGGSSHQADVYENADKLLYTIKSNKDWTFAFLGDRYIYLEQRCDDNYHIIGGMTILEYFRFINTENPSAMIFPLCNTIFNRGKSNISWIEASYAGSAFFGNKQLPEFDKESILDIKNMDELMKDTDLLHMMRNFSWQYILDNLLLSDINKLRTDRLLANL